MVPLHNKVNPNNLPTFVVACRGIIHDKDNNKQAVPLPFQPGQWFLELDPRGQKLSQGEQL
jgi:hypothetical protein